MNQQITAIQSDQAQAQEELDQLSDQLVDILTSIDICQDEIAVKEKEIEQAKKIMRMPGKRRGSVCFHEKTDPVYV